MGWGCCSLVVLQVAGNAGRAGEIVVVVDMAVRALPRWHSMASAKREANRIVVEVGIKPTIRAMAGSAGGGKFGVHMVRIRGVQVIRLMAGEAFGRHGLELAGCCAFVARIAVERRVGSGQWKTIIVILNLMHRDLPSPNRVALFAIGPKLASVNVGVAILTALSNIGEYRFYVALRTSNRLMHPEQRVTGLIVVEFRNCPDRLPRSRGVAVLTKNIQVAMWTVSFVRDLCRRPT